MGTGTWKKRNERLVIAVGRNGAKVFTREAEHSVDRINDVRRWTEGGLPTGCQANSARTVW